MNSFPDTVTLHRLRPACTGLVPRQKTDSSTRLCKCQRMGGMAHSIESTVTHCPDQCSGRPRILTSLICGTSLYAAERIARRGDPLHRVSLSTQPYPPNAPIPTRPSATHTAPSCLPSAGVWESAATYGNSPTCLTLVQPCPIAHPLCPTCHSRCSTLHAHVIAKPLVMP